MRWLRYALWPAGLAFGVAAEWIGQPQLIVFDAATGFALLFLGLASWSRRPGSRAGPIMSAAGFAWFLGSLWAALVRWYCLRMTSPCALSRSASLLICSGGAGLERR